MVVYTKRLLATLGLHLTTHDRAEKLKLAHKTFIIFKI